MERKFVFSEDEYYHIYNRGSEKRVIFTCEADYDRFLALLYLANSNKPFSIRDILESQLPRGFPSGSSNNSLFDYDRGETIVDVGAHCPMPNHFHLVLKEKGNKGISRFVMKVCTGYSMYFNKKYERLGTLFQGPFGAKHLDDDNYLKYNFAYSHLNPIKLIQSDWKEAGITDLEAAKDFLANYRYSSYLDYLGIDRPEGKILNKEAFPEYFQNPKEFQDFLDDWLDFRDWEDLPEGNPRGKESVV